MFCGRPFGALILEGNGCFSMSLEIVWWYLCSDVDGIRRFMLYHNFDSDLTDPFPSLLSRV